MAKTPGIILTGVALVAVRELARRRGMTVQQLIRHALELEEKDLKNQEEKGRAATSRSTG